MILRSDNLIKVYGRRHVVKGVSINVNQGEIVGLLGPNGAGKTTTFYMVVGFIQPNEGKVYLNDEEITTLPMYKRAQKGIGYLPQEPSVFRKLTVEDNVKAVLEMTTLSRAEQKDKLEVLIDEFNLHKVRKSRGDTLSGGERQAVAIARAVYFGAEVLILDEPTSALGVKQSGVVLKYIRQAKERGIGVVFITHNPHHAHMVGDRFYLLNRGALTNEFEKATVTREQLVKAMAGGAELEALAHELGADR